MPTGVEVAKAAIEDFKKIQRYMHFAKEEGAAKTYSASLRCKFNRY